MKTSLILLLIGIAINIALINLTVNNIERMITAQNCNLFNDNDEDFTNCVLDR